MAALYYLSNWLWRHRIPVLPRMIMLLIRFLFCSFLPYNLSIGRNVQFGHQLGVVINPTARIGNNVKIRHFVGIGGGPVIIEDDVEIGAGARLHGPIRVGRGALIGANAVVVKDVPPHVTVGGVPARVIRVHGEPRKDRQEGILTMEGTGVASNGR